jgi:hypothetical protein
VVAWVFVVGPMLCFEIMLCNLVEDPDTPLNYVTLFVPFFIWLFGWVLAACFVGFKGWKNRN